MSRLPNPPYPYLPVRCALCRAQVIDPMTENTLCYCIDCWLSLRCQATRCAARGHFKDGCGLYWCQAHEEQAIFMTVGFDLGFPPLSWSMRSGQQYDLPGGQALWFLFARLRKQRGVLREATWAALRLRLGPTVTQAARREVDACRT